MASITVDGRSIEAPVGAPLVEVLKRNGIYTSNLCYIDGLKPYAGCRTCLVDIQGPPGLQLSCTSLVQDGMVVTTASDEVKEARRAVVSLILANHSDRCLTCHRREHCHPGDICLRDDVVTHRCLTCSKNYRCELQATCEMVGMAGYEPWVGEERSFYQTPQPPADRANPFMEFDPKMCIICTRCQRACEDKRHTGAITLSGRGWDTQIAFGAGGAIHDSNCDFSGACLDVCPTAALMEHPNKWVSKPDTWTSTTCDSCAVGCSIRLGARDGRGVLVRPGEANPVSGDQICVRGRYHYDSLKPRERLARHAVRRGAIQVPVSLADAIAEAATALKAAATRGKVGVLVGATVTNEEAWLASRIAREALGTAADSSLGPVIRAVRGALEARIGGWRAVGDMTRLRTSKAIVLVHDDLEESHNVASVRIKDAVAHHRAKLIVIGALRSELVDFAALWIRTAPGEEGLAAARIADALAGAAPADADTASAVAILRDAPLDETLVVCAPNPASPAHAGSMAAGAANVAVALFADRASENLVVLPAEVNVHGLLDAGVAAEGSADPLAGLAGLLLVRDDPTMRLPAAAEALAATGTVVVIDNVPHAVARAATVAIAEGRAYASSGTYTQGDFRVQRLSPAVAPEGDAVPLFAALHMLGTALGLALPAGADATLGEITAANPLYQPAYDLLVGEGVRMAVTGTGVGRIVPVEARPAAAAGLQVIASRDLYTAADAAALRHPEAEKLHRYDHVQLSEEDGARMGIRNEDEVTLRAGAVSIRARATVTERVPAGAVYVSTLLQGGAVSQLFSGDGVPAVELLAGELQPVAAGRMAPQQQATRRLNPVAEIFGVGETWEGPLEAQGIVTPADLLRAAGAAPERRALAEALSVPASTVLEWVNRADLARIEGVSPVLANLLEDAGVDTVRELATRNPANLAARLNDVAAASGRIAPAPADIERWVQEAAALPPAVTH